MGVNDFKEYKHEPAKPKRLPRIPADFKDELIYILQTKYLAEDFTSSQVRSHIHEKCNILIEEEPLSYFIKRHELEKWRYKLSKPQDAGTTEARESQAHFGPTTSSTSPPQIRPIHDTRPGPCRNNHDSASPRHIRIYHSEVPTQITLGAEPDLKQSCISADIENSLLCEKSKLLLDKSLVTPNGLPTIIEHVSPVEIDFSITAPDTFSSIPLDSRSTNGLSELGKTCPDATEDKRCLSMMPIATNAKKNQKESSTLKRKLGLQQKMSKLVYNDGKGESVIAVLVDSVKRQLKSIHVQTPIDSSEYQRANDSGVAFTLSTPKVGRILNVESVAPKGNTLETNLSSADMEVTTDLVLALFCCGWPSEARQRCNSLITCLRREAASCHDQDLAETRFRCLTKLLTWMIPLGDDRAHLLPLLELWEILRQTQDQRTNALFSALEDQYASKGYQATELFAVRNLALTATTYGLYNFAEKVLDFWHEGVMDILTIRRSDKTPPQAHSHTCDLSLIPGATRWQSTEHCLPQPDDTVSSVIGAVIRWIREQLLIPFNFWDPPGLRLTLLYLAYQPLGTESLERQLLLMYLSSRRSKTYSPAWVDHVEAYVFDILPSKICQEWLSGGPPVLTIAILLHVLGTRQRRQCLPPPSSVDGWQERMLDGVNMLMRNGQDTVSEFHSIAHGNNLEELSFCQIRKEEMPLVSLEIVTKTVLMTTLFRLVSYKDTKPDPAWRSLPPGPTMLGTPGSSMSDMGSLKSIYERTRIGVSRTPLSSFDSHVYQQSQVGSSVEGSSGPLARSSVNSRRSRRASRRHHRYEDEMEIDHGRSGNDEDVMDMDL